MAAVARAAAATTFRLAHLSDVHVFTTAALWTPTLIEAKRWLGALNVLFRRGPNVYSRDVLRAALEDAVRTARVDHIAISGDLTNLATKPEFELAARTIADAADGCRVSAVPGNHDIYTPSSDRHRFFHRVFAEHMRSDVPVEGARDGFPFVQRLWSGRVALIGLNSARWRPPFIASGEVGLEQLDSLRRLLESDALKNVPYKVLMLHHPPLERYKPLDSHRFSLQDQASLQRVLREHPVDLVLHGHTHTPFAGALLPEGDPRRPWVYECGSSTFWPSPRKPKGAIARYNVYELHQATADGPVTLRSATARVLDLATGQFAPQPLAVPPPR